MLYDKQGSFYTMATTVTGHICIPKRIFYDERLSATDKLVYLAYNGHANNKTGLTWVGNPTIAQELGLDRKTVNRSYRRLVKFGAFTEQPRPGRTSITTVIFEPVPPETLTCTTGGTPPVPPDTHELPEVTTKRTTERKTRDFGLDKLPADPDTAEPSRSQLRVVPSEPTDLELELLAVIERGEASGEIPGPALKTWRRFAEQHIDAAYLREILTGIYECNPWLETKVMAQ